MRERSCCDGLCNENQGRGTCPRYRAPSVTPIFAVVITLLVSLIAGLLLVHFALRFSADPVSASAQVLPAADTQQQPAASAPRAKGARKGQRSDVEDMGGAAFVRRPYRGTV